MSSCSVFTWSILVLIWCRVYFGTFMYLVRMDPMKDACSVLVLLGTVTN